MRKITTAEQSGMTLTALESFNDLCNLYRASTSQDSDTGELITGYDSGTFNIACGLAAGSEQRNERGQFVTIDADAVLRLPYLQAVAVGDKIVSRGTIYAVDGVTPGRNVQILKLMEIKI